MSKGKPALQQAVAGWLAAHSDVSQRELATRAKIDHGDMSRIVRGDKASLAMESAGRLAAAMDVTVEDLLAGRFAADRPADLRDLAIELIDESPHNPRPDGDDPDLQGLADSIRENGLLQPLVVMGALGKPGRFELIFGHRRLRALKLNQAATARCFVRAGATTSTSRVLQIIENLQRADIPPLDEARAFVALQEENKAHWTNVAIAALIGKSDRFVAQRIALVRNLDPELREMVAGGGLTIEVARVLATAPVALQKAVATETWALSDADTVRRRLQSRAIPLSKAAFTVELYDGEFLEEDGKRWFANAAKFDRLQKKAAEGKVERLRKTGMTAAVVAAQDLHDYVWADSGDPINAYWGGKDEAETIADGLAPEDVATLVYLKDHDIKTVKGAVKRKTFAAKVQKTDDDDGDDAPDSWEEHRQEVQALNDSLAAGLAQRPDLARRLVVYGFLGVLDGLDAGGVTVRRFPPPLDALVEPFATFDSNGELEDCWDPRRGAEDGLWALLARQPDATIDAMLAHLMSRTVRLSLYGSRATGLVQALAATLGIAVPEALVSPAEDDDEDEDDADAGDNADADADAEAA